MELTAKEIEALQVIDRGRAGPKIAGWTVLFWGCVFFVNDAGGDWFSKLETSYSVVFLLTGLFVLSSAYFHTSPSDRLLELLKKYVNNDAEALQQITLARVNRRVM